MDFICNLKTYLCLCFCLIGSLTFGQVNSLVKKVTFLGVSASTLSERMSKQFNLPVSIYLSVDQVSSESPADLAGLKLYDVLLKMDDQILVNSAQLKALVRMKNFGDQVNLEILRKDKRITLTATLSEIEELSMPINPQTFGLKNTDPFSSNSFSSDFDQLITNHDPSNREILKKHGFSKLPRINNHRFGFDPDSLLHGSKLNSGTFQSFSYYSKQKHATTTDESGTYEYSIKKNTKHFRVISKDGEILFDGPVTHQSERDKLPHQFKTKLLELESM